MKSDILIRRGLRNRRRKAGISSVIGAIIVFGMLFTVAYGFFYSMNQSQTYYQRAIDQNNVLNTQKGQENLVVTATTGSSDLVIGVNNTGITTTIVEYILINATKGTNYGAVLASSSLSLAVPQGQSESLPSYNCALVCNVDDFLIKVITTRGNTFTGTYPQGIVNQALNAVSSGAFGDLYLDFNSYSYYTISQPSGCPSSGTNSKYSGYCLTPGGLAFTIPSAVSGSDMAFAISMTNLNPEKASITLDQFTLLYQAFPHASSGFASVAWYIISNETVDDENVIMSNYNVTTLAYGVPTTVVFAAQNCVTAANGPQSLNTDCKSLPTSGSGAPGFQYPDNVAGGLASGFTATVFIQTHGWEQFPPISVSSLSYSSANYGQNLPYVSTLYT